MNILHTLKHDFLIIGLTGPLRSGCTTAAKFFLNGLNESVAAHLDQYALVQSKIVGGYERIARFKEDGKGAELDREKDELKKLFRKREVIKVLRDYQANNFVYISMTDVLLKKLIENRWEPVGLDHGQKTNQQKLAVLENLVELMQKHFSDIERLKLLSQRTAERMFSAFTKEDFQEYERYIKQIENFRLDISQSISEREVLGELLQDFGDNARRCGRPMDYKSQYSSKQPTTIFSLAEEANNLLKFFRCKERQLQTNLPRVKQFVIEAFRNPYEVEFFRNRYFEFYLFSLYSELDTRQERDGSFSIGRDNRDKGENIGVDDFFKQNVSECVRIADIAITNKEAVQDLCDKLVTYFALLKQPGCFAPTWKETAMHMAYSMSVRSTCISRQVGAVIEGADGYIIGAGWNDVGAGQVGCGYRHYEDFRDLDSNSLLSNPPGEEAFRRLIELYGDDGESFCYKDKYSEYLIRKKLKKIEKDFPGQKGKISANEKRMFVERLQKEINVKMMQYCRALHAEENAILQTAVIGGIGIHDGTIYTTTFPCELCAKKIYQSGIRKVIYTEPYPRSISKDVFFQDGVRKIEFEQFEGVKSQSYFRLYKAAVDKKEFQMLQHMGGLGKLTESQRGLIIGV